MARHKNRGPSPIPGPFLAIPIEFIKDPEFFLGLSRAAIMLLLYFLSLGEHTVDGIQNGGLFRGARVMTYGMIKSRLGFSNVLTTKTLKELVDGKFLEVVEQGGRYNGEHIPARYKVGRKYPWYGKI